MKKTLFLSIIVTALAIYNNAYGLEAMTFPIESPDQANAYGYGMLQGANAQNALAQAQQTNIQNQYLGEKLRAELEQRQLQNEQLALEIAHEKEAPPFKIMIFSNTKQHRYLGCLNCSNEQEDSLNNANSIYVSSAYKNSIYNFQGLYGSQHSTFSACDPDAKHPPIVVDSSGNFYGLLTLNQSLKGAIKTESILSFLTHKVCM